MRHHLRFGLSEGELRLDDHRLSSSFRGPRGNGLSTLDIVRNALDNPVDAPPLRATFTPDDQVSVLVDMTLPDLGEVLSTVLSEIVHEGHVQPTRISIMHQPAPKVLVDALCEEIPDELADVDLVEHVPDNPKAFAYLASTQSGRRIYLDREITDADVIVGIARTGFDALTGRQGPSSLLFPGFSNSTEWERARRTALEYAQEPSSLHRRQECDEVASLAGMYYSLGIATGEDGAIDRAWLGPFESVQREADRHADEHWRVSMPKVTPDLVIAVVSPQSMSATWGSVATAISNAALLLQGEIARIALVSDLSEPLGPSLQLLRESADPLPLVDSLRNSSESDALPAQQLATALTSCKVFMLSNLDSEIVESLGMTPIASLREIENLASTSTRIFLLENADRVRVEVPRPGLYHREEPEDDDADEA